MNKRRILTTNKIVLYLIIFVLVLVAFLLLVRGHSTTGMMHGSRTIGTIHLNWAQILIGFGLGFLLGLVVARRK